MYLGEAWVAQYIPGAVSSENVELARKAEAEFHEVLKIEPGNETAVVSLASLKYQQAQGQQNAEEKQRMLEEAAAWYERAVGMDPGSTDSYYSLGVISWAKWYPAWIAAREQIGMKPNDPGPLTDPVVRARLKEQYGTVLEHGISNLEKALELDPMYDDAMAYMNLFVRERADLDDTPEQYAADILAADQWVQKTLETKRFKAAKAQQPPPRRIRVEGSVQQGKLIGRVDPVYPNETGVRVQGEVRLAVVIGTDGHVQNVQLVSGHPLLAKAAMDAVRQWQYSPTLVNGEAVEVETQVDINVALP